MKSLNRAYVIAIILITLSLGQVSAFTPPKSSWTYSSSKEILLISVSNYGQTLIAFDDKSVAILDKDMKLTQIKSYSSNIDAISISPEGTRILIATLSTGGFGKIPPSNVYMYDISGKLLWKTEIESKVVSIDISSDNNFIAVGSECTKKVAITDCNVIYLLDNQGEILWSYLSSLNVDKVKLSESGDYLAVLQKSQKKILVFNKEGDLLSEYKSTLSEKYVINDMAIMQDGSAVMNLYIQSGGSGVFNRMVEIQKLQSLLEGDASLSWRYHIEGANAKEVTASDDGKYILVFKQTGEKSDYNNDYRACCSIYLFNENGDILWEEIQDNWLASYQISPDGRYISGYFSTGTKHGISFYDNSQNIAPAPTTTPPPTTTPAPTTAPPTTTPAPTTTPPPTTTPAPTTTPPPLTVVPIVTSEKEVVDTDGDGWSDELENRIGTDPQNPDTDGDGIIDSKDPNPLKYGGEMGADSDGDGWSDELEKKAGTDPFEKDTDGDGLWDSKDPNPLMSEGEENGINWEALGVSLAVLAATGGWLVTKRKKRRLKGLLSEIDRAYESTKEDISKCKAELKKLREKILDELKKDNIDEGSYEILKERIESCLKELKEKSRGSRQREGSQCKKCGAHLPIGSYGQVRCEFCNTPNYVPIPGEKA